MTDSQDHLPTTSTEQPNALAPLEIGRILAPTDLSEHSEGAVRYAIRLALALHAKAVLLYVSEVYVNPPPEGAGFGMISSYEVQGWRDDERRRFDAYLERFGPLPPGVERLRRSASDPWREMLAVAAEVNADLLVVSTHGRAGLQHLLHGSHADRLLREAPCPVLVVRSPHPFPQEPG